MQFLDADAEQVAELRRVPAESDVEVLVDHAGEEHDDEVAAALDVPLERGGQLVVDDEVNRYDGEPVVPWLGDDVGRDAEVPEGLVHRADLVEIVDVGARPVAGLQRPPRLVVVEDRRGGFDSTEGKTGQSVQNLSKVDGRAKGAAVRAGVRDEGRVEELGAAPRGAPLEDERAVRSAGDVGEALADK